MGITDICGPKLSACCLIISVWGVIQLAVMGAAFYVNSPNLIEDVGIDEHKWAEANDGGWEYFQSKYQQAAKNCWVAAAFYVITLVLSSVTCYLNSKKTMY